MPKKAFLVGFAPQTRIVVDVPEGYNPAEDGDVTDRIIREARAKMLSDAANYLCGDNCDRLEEDTECPFGAFEDDNKKKEFLFTVNDSGKKVKFAPGNLFWDGEKFAFEEHQYDFPKKWNPKHVGHFFWTGFRQGGNADAAIDEIYDDPDASVNDAFFAADGGVMENWTVLSKDEWNYIIKNHLGRHKVNIAGVNCAVLVPDGVEASVVNDFYTAREWATAEAQYGLVALPFAGYRYGTSFTHGGSYGGCWSATPSSSDLGNACYAGFNSSNAYTDYCLRYYGSSIRLVSVQ